MDKLHVFEKSLKKSKSKTTKIVELDIK